MGHSKQTAAHHDSISQAARMTVQLRRRPPAEQTASRGPRGAYEQDLDEVAVSCGLGLGDHGSQSVRTMVP